MVREKAGWTAADIRRILAATTTTLPVIEIKADRIRRMAGRRLRVFSRVLVAICGLVSLVTAAPYAMLQGISLPYQSEWVIFVVALGLAGIFALMLAVARRAWIAKVCNLGRDDKRLFSEPLKWLAGVAAVFYLVAVFAYFAPHTWNLNPQVMLAVCPMYLLKMTFDPSPALVFFLLAPMNAAVFGSVGVVMGLVTLGFRARGRG